jgi:fatty-acyl-CoA synthase
MPAVYLRLVDELGATVLFMVPTMFQMIQADPAFEATDLSRVRWAISGGAPCPLPLRDAFGRAACASSRATASPRPA